MHNFQSAYIIFFIALVSVVYSMSLWFRDVIVEGTYLGNHTLAVQKGINLGVALFIISEIFFFLAIF
jgi:cytochrome c oxidase subunit 3